MPETDALAGQSAGDEHRLAVDARDAAAVVSRGRRTSASWSSGGGRRSSGAPRGREFLQVCGTGLLQERADATDLADVLLRAQVSAQQFETQIDRDRC